jgi:hypothetical protein
VETVKANSLAASFVARQTFVFRAWGVQNICNYLHKNSWTDSSLYLHWHRDINNREGRVHVAFAIFKLVLQRNILSPECRTLYSYVICIFECNELNNLMIHCRTVDGKKKNQIVLWLFTKAFKTRNSLNTMKVFCKNNLGMK